MKTLFAALVVCLIPPPVFAPASLANADQVVDKISGRERALVESLKDYTPIAETYIQELAPRGDRLVVVHDHYFLSQARLGPQVDILPFRGTRKGSPIKHFAKSMFTVKMEYLPEGFAQMAHPDVSDFDREHYTFTYLQHERIEESDCLIFDVSPLGKYAKKEGMFEGRIWVENQDYTIVRYRGDFLGGNDVRGHYFHFDTFRVNAAPGLWLPATIYTKETEYAYNKVFGIATARARFKAETHFWGYEPQPYRDEATELNLSSTETPEVEAEDKVTERLGKLGLLARRGEVDDLLTYITTGLEADNNLLIQPKVRCRVLLTTRLEFFTVGHTIVVSRGLIDVSPYEQTLAAILSLGLARIALFDASNTKHRLADQVGVDPEDTLLKMSFVSAPSKRQKIRELAASYLSGSSYKDSIQSVKEFFAELADKSSHIPELAVANLGDALVTEMIYSGPGKATLNKGNRQPAALALGSRTMINPWTDELEMLSPSTLRSDWTPFEVTALRTLNDGTGSSAAKVDPPN